MNIIPVPVLTIGLLVLFVPLGAFLVAWLLQKLMFRREAAARILGVLRAGRTFI
jgi:positive regulator of sigma E activity